MSRCTGTPTSAYDYSLPPELIAQAPAADRGGSRMMVLDRRSGDFFETGFPSVVDFLSPGDCVVVNNTRVIKARLFGRKQNPGGSPGAKIEALMLGPSPSGSPAEWDCMLKPAKRLPPGSVVTLEKGEDFFTVKEKNPDGVCAVEFSSPDVLALLRKHGHVPLPPYIQRPDNSADGADYQTVFAEKDGAVAAPTAGLHFTNEIIELLKVNGVFFAPVTLHVGAGTFRPVTAEFAEDHAMHSEVCEIPEASAQIINARKKAGSRIFAVGTTSVRTLESFANPDGTVRSGRTSTSIFLYPPQKPKVADMLLTNFHLPKSTLLMLVCCFAPREKVLAAYQKAIESKFRFFSYGNCMLLR